MKSILALLILAAAIVAGACSDNLPSAQEGVPLPGTLWRLVSIESDGRTEPVDSANGVSLSFVDAATVSGFAGCGGFSAAYSVDGAAITFRELTATTVPCPRATLQSRYLAALGDASGYIATGTSLRLYAAGGSVVLNFVRATSVTPPVDPTPRNVDPVGKIWRLEAIETASLEIIDPRPAVYLMLKPNGQAIGRGPCNEIDAHYTIDSTTIIFTDVRLGDNQCPRSPLERRYKEHLELATTYRSSDDTLRITFNGGVLHYGRIDSIPRDQPPPSILNREWKLRSIKDRDGRIEEPVTAAGISIVFEGNGRFSGLGACNRYEGEFDLEGARLRVTRLNGPMNVCLDRDIEMRYLEHLRRAERIQGDDVTLQIVTSTGVTLEYGKVPPGTTVPPDPPQLPGTRWRLREISRGGPSQPIDNGVEIVLSFTSASTLAGTLPCGSYQGEYTTSGSGGPPTLRTQNIESTLASCTEFGPLEKSYLLILRASRNYNATPQSLTIVSDDGVLHFSRVR